MLRDGRMVAEAAAGDVDTHWIVEQMTGGPAGAAEAPGAAHGGPELLRAEALSLTNQGGRPVLRDVSLSVRAGEVVAIYGLMGAGRTELLECLMGLHPEAAGSVFLDSKRVDHMPACGRISSGLAMVPEDRQAAGLVQSLSVLANMTLVQPRQVRARAVAFACPQSAPRPKRWRPIFASRLLDWDATSNRLSGGNQQKVVIAKCLLTGPRVLLAGRADPGRGRRRQARDPRDCQAPGGVRHGRHSGVIGVGRSARGRPSHRCHVAGRDHRRVRCGGSNGRALAVAASACPDGTEATS